LIPGIGMTELLVILVIVLLIFGAGKLPQIGSGMGKAIRGFKDAIAGKDAIDVTPKKVSEAETKETKEGNSKKEG